jgi:hypothetical protein
MINKEFVSERLEVRDIFVSAALPAWHISAINTRQYLAGYRW